MGVSIPGVTGLLNQPIGQIINGSLNFEGGNNQALKRTPTTAGNRRTWTYSCWVKKQNDNRSSFFSAGTTSSDTGFSEFGLGTQKRLRFSGWNTNWRTSFERLRDYNQFYHFVVAFDATQSTAADKVKIYKNGVQITIFNNNNEPSDVDYAVNDTVIHYIGGIDGGGGENLTFTDFSMTQVYFIDGQQLGPENFGFTDPLTNTWRPKKFTGNFYLPGSGVVYSDNGSGTVNGLRTYDKAFDGSTSTFCEPSDNQTITFDFTSLPGGGITVGSSLRMYLNKAGTPADGHFTVNGTNLGGSVPSGDWLTINSVSRLDTITFYHQSGSSSVELYAVEVDGSILTDGTAAQGVNSFYLPMDGNSPIGQDKSGRGNDWTPVNFGGSVSLDNPTASGALPILNTTQGGTQATVGVRTDEYASSLVLALPLVGNTDDVSNQINSGSTTKTITSNGNPAASTSDSNFYSGSYEFDGTNDCLTSSDCGSGATEYTMECWFNTDGFSQNQRPINMSQDLNGSRYLYAEVRTDKKLQIREESTGSAVSADAVFASNKWHHLAVSYDGVRLRGFVDGVFVVQTSANGSPVALGNNMKMRVGADESNTSSNEFDGHIQDVRVYFGACKYTATNIGDQAFVVPATSPDILPDTPSGVSGSSKLTKITEGAVSFDGSGDDLEIADSADFEFGTGDFTIECFAYHTEDSDDHLISKYGSSDADRSWRLVSDGNQTIIFYWYYSTSSSLNITSAAGKFSLNSWHHIVAQRTSGNIYLFVDGELVGSNTSSGAASEFNDNSTAVVIAGDKNGSSQDFPGYISNVRIVKGTGVYNTTGFTPPTKPLTNVTNTKLLCCQSNNTTPLRAEVLPTTGAYTLTGVNYSSGSQVTGSDGLTGKDNLFNGFIGQYADTNNYAKVDVSSDNFILWTPTSAISYSSSVEIYCYAANGYDITNYYSLNGGTDTSFTGGTTGFNNAAWVTVATGSGTLTSLRVRLTRGGGNTSQVNWYAIRIDGTVLTNDFNGVPMLGDGNVKATNFNPFNTDINTVRGQETGYATLNPLSFPYSNSGDTRIATVSNGNLTYDGVASYWGPAFSTMPLGTTGKYYFETIPHAASNVVIGVGKLLADPGNRYWDQGTGTQTFYYSGGNIGSNGSTLDSSPASIAAFDVIGFAMDCDNNEGKFYKNGALQATVSMPDDVVTAKDAGTVYPFCDTYNGTNVDWNFGQKPFKFPPPDGFQPLNLANVRPSTVIARPDQYVGVTTYTGSAPTAQQITGLNFGTNPDFVWVKNYSNATGYHHGLFDTVRGPNKVLASSDTADEGDTTQQLMSFDHNGFTVGTNSDNQNYVNLNNDSYVAWCWKAGGDKNTFNVDGVGYANASDVGMSVGGLNSATYNTSENWLTTGTITGTPHSAPYTFSPLFDGDLTGLGPQSNSSSTQYIYTFGSALSANADSIIFYSTDNEANVPNANTGGFYINGTQVTTSNCTRLNNSSPYKYRMNGLTTLSSIGTQQKGNMTGIEVNGKLLIDSNAHTPPNIPEVAATGCSVGTKQGFSIIRWTAPTWNGSPQSVPHGLTQSPSFIITKVLDDTASWYCYHKDLDDSNPQNYYVALNQPQNKNTLANGWGTSPPNNTTFGDRQLGWSDGKDVIAYIWHDVPGLQKFGKYTGVNNSKGPYLDLGFRPAVIMFKNIQSGSTEWVILDNKRDGYNGRNKILFPSTSGSENATQYGDFLSNGWKFRINSSYVNSTDTFIYAAWAETPSINLYGGQANAR